jgi:hypothetical protein
MALHTYTCAKCGREKQIEIQPGQSIEDAKGGCGCGSKSDKINGLDIMSDNKSGCGCGGGGCGCH